MENTNRPECLPATFENGDVTTTRVDTRTPAERERWSAPAWTDRDEKQLEELFPGMVTVHLDPPPPATLVAGGHGLREPGLMAEAVAKIPGAVLIEDFDNAALSPGDLTVMCADTSKRLLTQEDVAESFGAALAGGTVIELKRVPESIDPAIATEWMESLAKESDNIAHRARQIELPRLPNHAERTAANKARREAAAVAPFQTWTCVRCGSEITTVEEAADHRRLNLIGRGACRRAARALREEARAALGQKPKKRRTAAGPRGYVYETPDRTFWPTKFKQNGAKVSFDDVESHVRCLDLIPVDASPVAA